MGLVKSKCDLCKKIYLARTKDMKKSNTHFCSMRCRTIFHNRLRFEPRKTCKRIGCSNKVSQRHSIYCSQDCSALDRRKSHNHFKNKTLNGIKLFVDQHDRIPTKREVHDLHSSAKRAFGTWNKAIVAAGFEPNPVMFSKRFMANDGHWCDSLSEKILDDWLFSRNIFHQINYPYPGKRKLTVDFKIGDYWIELFGLTGQLKKYDQQKQEKLEIAKKFHLKLIPIHLSDIFSPDKLVGKLNPILQNHTEPI